MGLAVSRDTDLYYWDLSSPYHHLAKHKHPLFLMSFSDSIFLFQIKGSFAAFIQTLQKLKIARK